MKKLTDIKGSATLDAFVDIMGEDNITSKGNLKGMATDEKELEKNIDEVYTFWQTRGFPYYSTDETWRKEKMSKLRAVDCKNLLTKDGVIKPLNPITSTLCFIASDKILSQETITPRSIIS